MLLVVETLYVYEGTVEEAAVAVGEALRVRLELRDSSYFGGDYYRAEQGVDQVILLENYMEDDNEPFFETQPVGAICVRVSGFDEARELLARVPGLRAVDAP
jgi:hypothetical protein